VVKGTAQNADGLLTRSKREVRILAVRKTFLSEIGVVVACNLAKVKARVRLPHFAPVLSTDDLVAMMSHL
jgi:hypothetical protein